MSSLISLVETDLLRLVQEAPVRESRYRKAGSPTCCQNPHCKRPFERACVCGDDDRYCCSEVCAQIGMEIDLRESKRWDQGWQTPQSPF